MKLRPQHIGFAVVLSLSVFAAALLFIAIYRGAQ